MFLEVDDLAHVGLEVSLSLNNGLSILIGGFWEVLLISARY